MVKAPKTKRTESAGIPKRAVAPKTRKLTTTITVSTADLAALADYSAAGMILLRITTPHRVIGKLKAAMTRLQAPIPRGL